MKKTRFSFPKSDYKIEEVFLIVTTRNARKNAEYLLENRFRILEAT